MIEKILERLEAEADFFGGTPMGTLQKMYYCKGVEKAIEIVQEVAKEYEACEVMRSNCEVEDGGWIPVEERLPNWEIEEDYTEDVHTVLQWYDGYISYGVGWYNKNFGWNEDCANRKVIAWKQITPYQKGE